MSDQIQYLYLDCRGTTIKVSNFEIDEVNLFKTFVSKWNDDNKSLYLPYSADTVNMFLSYINKDFNMVNFKKIESICKYVGVNFEMDNDFTPRQLSDLELIKLTTDFFNFLKVRDNIMLFINCMAEHCFSNEYDYKIFCGDTNTELEKILCKQDNYSNIYNICLSIRKFLSKCHLSNYKNKPQCIKLFNDLFVFYNYHVVNYDNNDNYKNNKNNKNNKGIIINTN